MEGCTAGVKPPTDLISLDWIFSGRCENSASSPDIVFAYNIHTRIDIHTFLRQQVSPLYFMLYTDMCLFSLSPQILYVVK